MRIIRDRIRDEYVGLLGVPQPVTHRLDQAFMGEIPGTLVSHLVTRIRDRRGWFRDSEQKESVQKS